MKRYKQYLEPDTTCLLPRTTKFRSNTYSSNNDAPGPSNNEHPELEDRNSVNGTEVHMRKKVRQTKQATEKQWNWRKETVDGDSETASDGEVTEADESDEGSDDMRNMMEKKASHLHMILVQNLMKI